MSAVEMTCAEAEPLLPLVADGVLDPDGDPALFAHLARCVQCQDALARHDLVTLALERGQPAAAVRRPRLRLLVPAALAAAAVLALAAGLWWWQADGQTPSIHPVAALPSAPAPAAGRSLTPAPALAQTLAAEEPRILRQVGPEGQVRYLIQHPDRVQVVDLGAIDGAGGVQRGDVVPVRW